MCFLFVEQSTYWSSPNENQVCKQDKVLIQACQNDIVIKISQKFDLKISYYQYTYFLYLSKSQYIIPHRQAKSWMH